MPSGRAAWGYAMCMVAYQVVEEGVCRLGGQHGDMLCVCQPRWLTEGVCRLGGQHGDMLCVW